MGKTNDKKAQRCDSQTPKEGIIHSVTNKPCEFLGAQIVEPSARAAVLSEAVVLGGPVPDQTAAHDGCGTRVVTAKKE
ncbi:hypothetical protein E2C01_056027 [Portunus trituberculatus]|uniref:Uncharacterized protein n=1 Tax=Portunus trituberculatus TaxID=210409 RepID=A0A5B7GYI8_PORTR|nr:hypothetical protein [Portunus trituberculatus]